MSIMDDSQIKRISTNWLNFQLHSKWPYTTAALSKMSDIASLHCDKAKSVTLLEKLHLKACRLPIQGQLSKSGVWYKIQVNGSNKKGICMYTKTALWSKKKARCWKKTRNNLRTPNPSPTLLNVANNRGMLTSFWPFVFFFFLQLAQAPKKRNTPPKLFPRLCKRLVLLR